MKILAAMLAAAAYVAAQALTVTFDAPLQTASLGDTVTFTGTLVNDDPTDLFIAGDAIAQDAPNPGDWEGLIVDDAFLANFLADYPGLFPTGASWSGALFSVAVGPTVTAWVHAGSFALLDDAGAVLADANFAVGVQAVPEPASLAALLTGALFERRRRR